MLTFLDLRSFSTTPRSLDMLAVPVCTTTLTRIFLDSVRPEIKSGVGAKDKRQVPVSLNAAQHYGYQFNHSDPLHVGSARHHPSWLVPTEASLIRHIRSALRHR